MQTEFVPARRLPDLRGRSHAPQHTPHELAPGWLTWKRKLVASRPSEIGMSGGVTGHQRLTSSISQPGQDNSARLTPKLSSKMCNPLRAGLHPTRAPPFAGAHYGACSRPPFAQFACCRPIQVRRYRAEHACCRSLESTLPRGMRVLSLASVALARVPLLSRSDTRWRTVKHPPRAHAALAREWARGQQPTPSGATESKQSRRREMWFPQPHTARSPRSANHVRRAVFWWLSSATESTAARPPAGSTAVAASVGRRKRIPGGLRRRRH